MSGGPRRVGRYEVLREVGRGRAAVVYLAHQADPDREVALKELSSLHGADPTVARRFLEEARVAGSLSHPNIVTVYDHVEDRGTPYIAMEYLVGGSLRARIGGLTLAQIGGVLEGSLAGLAHAERRRILHGDLTPENLMVTSEGAVKIADFGIAAAVGRATMHMPIATRPRIGTPAYAAPELSADGEAGPWTDLYSLGIIARELILARGAFEPDRSHGERTPVGSLRSIDPSLARWIGHLVEDGPTDRYQRALDAWDDLEDILLNVLGPQWRRGSPLPDASSPSATDRLVIRFSVPRTPDPTESRETRIPPSITPDVEAEHAGGAGRPDPPETSTGRPGHRHRKIVIGMAAALIATSLAVIVALVQGGVEADDLAGGLAGGAIQRTSPRPTVTATAPASTPTPTPTATLEIPPPPRPTLAPMAGGGGFVWLGNKNGSVTQIRSANNRTITPVADRAVRLVAATVDGGAWALFGSVDAPSATLRKVSKNEHVIQLHMSPINGVAIVRNHIWVLGDHTMTEVKENGKIGDTVDTPDSSMSIVAGTTVFVAGPDEIRQYKPSGESFGRAVEITNIRAIALTSAGPSKGLWVAADEYLVRVDPQTMSIGPHPRDLPAAPLALVSTRDAVWLLFDDGIVWALGREAATTLVTKVPSGATPVGMTAQGDSAYVLMSDGMIFAIDDEAGPKHGIIKAFPNTACDHC